ncbi:DENN domain-containing protein 1B isoform X2 [Melanotaenia boesemani]|uniref:DENN domain-containing protein 1B isoform X2 n=1 Tax=Melanotaenia boesemani TaxID=1250792 RepID=UPI001C0429FF|nr:DENN domain-containing protein 1B isoform X2 [Melanotaenia boesemani]
MGSRLKQNPERTFNWFFEATCPVAIDKDPGVLFQFPEDFNDEESCQTLPRFCFPYDIQRVRDGVAVQHFTFVLTDLEGCQRFGFCRLNNSTHNCLCILSYLPWFEVFYKLLNNLADYLTKGQTTEMKGLLSELYKQPIPLADGSVTLQMVPYFIAPDPRSLPSIPENRNLTELIVAVDVGNLLQLYASMLFERRILIFASKLSTLTSCVHALSAALYPMYWQHIFIPVLPPHLLDYCCAPMPYLIGVHTSLSERVRSRGLEEVVILNVDTNTLETPFDDLKRIPSDVMSGLKVCLKRQAVSPGSGVSRAFLKAQALLFGGYRDALQGQKEGEIHFSKELFLDHKSSSMRQFLQSAIHLQFFKQFIDDRLDIVNKGKEPDDLFEEEIIMCETTAGKSKSYHQLVGNLKKGGGALIHNMKTKANMRAKGLTKSGLKNLLINKAQNEERSLQRGGSVSYRRAQSDSLQNRLPITQHFGMSRPCRPVKKLRDKDNTKDSEDPWNSAVFESVSKTDSELQRDEEEGDDSPLCDPEEMDLLGEIFDTLSSRSSHERGVLYGTRSLDLFGPDSHDYITKRGPGHPSQESLSLSISGSGSLHSWNLETTEELSDLTEDSDWLCLDTSLAEEEGADDLHVACELRQQDRGQKEDREKEQETNVAINGKQEGEEMFDRNTLKEVKLEEDRMTEDQKIHTHLVEDPVNDMTEGREDEEVKDKKEDKQSEGEEAAAGQETQTGTNEMEENVTEEIKEIQEIKDSFSRCTKLNPSHPNAVQEQQDEEKIPAVLQQPESLAADLKPPAGQEKQCEIKAKKEEKEVRLISSSPKIQSAVVRFQSEAPSKGFPVRPMTKILAAQTHQPHDSERKKCSETPQEEDCPPIKVSELKKRFEA